MSTKNILLAGTCPICGGKDLNYDDFPIFEDNIMRWSFECRDCNAYGFEENSLVFQGTMISGNSEYGSVNTYDTYYNAGDEIDVKERPKCLYCGQTTDSTDPRVLCSECREDFGHTFFDEL